MGIKDLVSGFFKASPKVRSAGSSVKFRPQVEELPQLAHNSSVMRTLPGPDYLPAPYTESPEVSMLAAAVPADLNILNGKRLTDPQALMAEKQRARRAGLIEGEELTALDAAFGGVEVDDRKWAEFIEEEREGVRNKIKLN